MSITYKILPKIASFLSFSGKAYTAGLGLIYNVKLF